MGHHHTHASRGGVGGLGLAAAVPALLDRATNRPPMTSRIPTSCGSFAITSDWGFGVANFSRGFDFGVQSVAFSILLCVSSAENPYVIY
uniref:Uncharacterized protein n=1 Tax=Setaria italica TaxID=4555 RepID=K3XRP8_SETIT